MAIETATYIGDLNVSNPPGSDPVGQADDHIRLLKSVIKSTFPNITGPVSSTQAQLNYGPVPTGGILMWSGSASAVPTGWALCDGGTYAKTDGSGNIIAPNLTNKFILGSGATTAAPTTAPTIGTTGGNSSVTPTITVTNEAVALTTTQMPSHTHTATVTDAGHTHTASQPAHSHTEVGNVTLSVSVQAGVNYSMPATFGAQNTSTAQPAITVNSATTGITVSNSSNGSGGTHIHNNTAVSSAVATVPPYYVLAFIIKK